MTNDPVFQRLLEISWRRRLTEAEDAELRAWLAAHPESRAEWELETSLSHALVQLGDVPVPSNFTSGVLQAAERELLAADRKRGSAGWWQHLWRWRWAPGTAVAAVLLTTGLAVHVHNVHVRHDLLKSVALVAEASALPNTEVLANFQAIRVMSSAPQPDDQLLALLQ